MRHALTCLALGASILGCSNKPTAAGSAATRQSAREALVELDRPVLGGLRSAWIRELGDPTTGLAGDLFSGGVEVAWMGEAPSERAWHIEVLLTGAVPVDQARVKAAIYHPSDAQSIRRYTARAGQTIEVFQSASLARAFAGMRDPFFGGSLFGDEREGTYIQIAERSDAFTRRVVLAVGNSP